MASIPTLHNRPHALRDVSRETQTGMLSLDVNSGNVKSVKYNVARGVRKQDVPKWKKKIELNCTLRHI
jgi:hypothetical protein